MGNVTIGDGDGGRQAGIDEVLPRRLTGRLLEIAVALPEAARGPILEVIGALIVEVVELRERLEHHQPRAHAGTTRSRSRLRRPA